MSFDPTNFIKGMMVARAKAIKAMKEAVTEFAESVGAESQELVPVSPPGEFLPREKGAPRKQKRRRNPRYTGTSGSLQDSMEISKPQERGSVIEIEIGYHTDYAAAVHERLDQNHQYPGAVKPRAQAKFLEQPMREYTPRFLPLLRNKLREAL